MHLSSARRRLLGATLLLLVFLGLAFALAGSPRPVPTVGPAEIGTGQAALGETVYLEGELLSAPSERVLILAPAGADAPRVEVELAPPAPGFRIGEASHVRVVGTVASVGRLENAWVIRPSPPSKYIEAVSGGTP